MKYLILTEPDDFHALMTKLALERLGHQVRLLFTADQPTKQKNSIFITNDSYQWKMVDDYSSLEDNDYDVVWWRRARAPSVPKDKIHEKDYDFVRRENRALYEAVTDNMAPDAWWINNKEASIKAHSKIYQLKHASKVGLQIPVTLCSNNPQDIRYFLLQNEDEGVIYKPFFSNFWLNKNHTKVSYTSKITFLELPSNKLLQYAPGLYQKEIKKKYELRVTCFGDYLITVKLNSQAHAESKVDWRAISHLDLQVELYQLPLDIENKIKAFMKNMGLVFGCLDFIVSEEGEYIFLEVNEQGQFLWIEDANPQLKMLDVFVQFLLSRSTDFQWHPKETNFSLSDFHEEAEELYKIHQQRHVNLNILTTINFKE